jgi:hypothetical protein
MPETKPTAAESVQEMTAKVVKVKAWARAKAATLVRDAAANGGEPTKAMKKALSELEAEAGPMRPEDNIVAEPIQGPVYE